MVCATSLHEALVQTATPSKQQALYGTQCLPSAFISGARQTHLKVIKLLFVNVCFVLRGGQYLRGGHALNNSPQHIIYAYACLGRGSDA